MLKQIKFLLCFFVASVTFAQTNQLNYTVTHSYREEAKTELELENLSDDDIITDVMYYDGLGREMQSISLRAGGTKKDIITLHEYDKLGRKAKTFLPYSDNRTNINFRWLYAEADFYSYYKRNFPEEVDGETINPYSETHFEASPLNRVLEQGAPGIDWKVEKNKDTDHTVKFSYLTNTDSDFVRIYEVLHPNNNTEDIEFTETGIYEASTLIKTITKDENWTPTSGNNHTTQEFKNTQGQIILKRVYNNEKEHNTYYVYDDFGNLTFVLPPICNDGHFTPSQYYLDKYAYQYKYDHRNRLVEKKLPAKEWEYIVYDLLDRPVLTQDWHLREKSQWLFTKYDAFNRLVYTGLMNGGSRLDLQAVVNNQTNLKEERLLQGENSPTVLTKDPNTVLYYTNNAYPNGELVEKVLTIMYYDNYSWDTTNGTSSKIYGLETKTGILDKDNDGSSIEKNVPNGWGNSGFTTIGRVENDGYISFIFRAPFNNQYTIGLTREDATLQNDNENTIDYGIYINGAANNDPAKGTYTFMEKGIAVYGPIAFTAGADVFKVERVDKQIHYKVDDVIIYTSYQPSLGVLLGDGAIYTQNAEIFDTHIGVISRGSAYNKNVKGLVTGTKSRSLDLEYAPNKDQWITNAMYYDDKARLVLQTTKNDILDYKDGVTIGLNFAGEIISSTNRHIGNYSGTPQQRNYTARFNNYTYDQRGRLVKQTQQINNTPKELLFKNTYDELGQLVQKKVGVHIVKYNKYTNIIGLSVQDGIITKPNTGTNNWDAGLSTINSIAADGLVSFKVLENNKDFAVGLSYSDTDVDDLSMNYALVFDSQGYVYFHEQYVGHWETETYIAGDVFAVERRGNTIYYLKNNTVVFEAFRAATNQPLFADVSIYSASSNCLKDVTLGDLDKALQNVDYSYNIRGWLTKINDIDEPNNNSNDLFKFKINYNSQEGSSSTQFGALYNGNISQTQWKTATYNPSNGSNPIKTYGYQYDHLNRITKAIMRSGTDTNIGYHLNDVQYDLHGNIKKLKRSDANGFFDDLDYQYDGNQLLKVTDAIIATTANGEAQFKDGNTNGDDYQYDLNGNLTVDKNKNITSIIYNHLNLPKRISFNGYNSIEYIYDANGVKQSKIVSEDRGFFIDTKKTDYAGDIIYETNNYNDPEVKFIMQPEGYVEPTTANNFTYVYQYKDHLGNIRLSYSDSNGDGKIQAASEIIEENNYYPFGLQHKGYNNVVNGTENNYKTFLGQEMNKELGLNWLTFRHRNYMPEIGRFFGVDPVSAEYVSISTYQFAHNNPVWKIEIEGLEGASVNEPDIINQERVSHPVGSSISGSDAVRNVSAHGAYTGIQSSRVRTKYQSTVSKLDVSNSAGRTQAKMSARANTPAIVNAMIESKRPSSVERQKTSGTANKTNAGANNTAKNIGRAGKGLLVVGVIASANNIANAENTGEAVATEAGSWTGAIIGGEMGATAGASGGPWGALAGGIVGSIAGGIVGEQAVIDAIGPQNPAMQRSTSIPQDIKIGDLSPQEMVRKHSCFVKGTKVLMSDSTLKNIEDIRKGDLILSVDIKTNKIESDVVLLVPTELKKYRKIVAKFGNETVTEFSPAHPFYVKGKGWSVYDLEEAKKELKFTVSKLEKGDTMFYYKDGVLLETKIISIEDTGSYIEMYNVENVKKNHTFFANGILVHNKYMAQE